MKANGKSRSGSVYNYALAVIGVGYVVLLVVLLSDEPSTPRVGSVDERKAAQLVGGPATNLALQYGFKRIGVATASCRPQPPVRWACDVSGFVDARDNECTVKMTVDLSHRRPLVSPAGWACGGPRPPAAPPSARLSR